MMPNRQLRVCHVASGDLWAGAEVQIVGLLEQLRTFPDLAVSAVLLNKGKLLDELFARGIPVALYDETRLSSLQLLKAFYRHFRGQGFDTVHTHRYKENILAGIAAKLASVPHAVQTVHGLQERMRGWDRAKLGAYAWMNRRVARWTDQGIIGVSEEIAAVMKRALPRNPVVCVHNGIDLKKVRPAVDRRQKRQQLGIPENALVIGTVGRLVPVKGIDCLLRAICALRQDLGEVPLLLLIVGDGPLRPTLESLARELAIDQQTLFLGTRDDVYELMNMFDIYALPSLHEGISMALLEAMALARPVVASRVGGIPELVTDGAEGRLVPAQGVAALSQALKELAVSPPLREQMGRAGRERIARSYQNKETAAEVRDLYWSLANASAGRSEKFSFAEEGRMKGA
jgi:glycosyltransferase involved in cell wall biosynthesis